MSHYVQYLFFPEASLCSVRHSIPINNAVIYTTFVPYCPYRCLQEKNNLYLNLFFNISFVLIYLFCYYHATVIENIVYTRSIMHLAFAMLYFQLKCITIIWSDFVIFFGVMCLTCCLVFLIAVLCSTFSDEKIKSVGITWLKKFK